MDREGIKQFMREINAKGIVDQPEWVMARCPLAPWNHASRQDSNPSFGISVHDDDTSMFHCFTCHEKGPLVYLLELLEDFSGADYSQLREDFGANEEFGPPLGEFKTMQEKTKTERLGEPISKDFIEIYEWPGHYKKARSYLIKRGISAAVCKRLQLRYDPEEERILFPCFAPNGDLHGFSGRAIGDSVEPRIKDYHGLKKRLIVLGSHLVADAPYVVITEGLFDYAVLQSYELPAVCLQGTALIEHKVALLRSFGKPLYLFFDLDGPGDDATREYGTALIEHCPVMVCEYPQSAIQRIADEQEDAGVDPAKLTAQEARWAIEAAELFI